VLIIGAGIAGAAAAYMIGARARVILLEREAQPGYHSTGRSAALFTETYGTETTRALTVASRAFMVAPPAGFTEHPLLTPRGVLIVGPAEARAVLEEKCATFGALVASVRMLDAPEIAQQVPVLRPEAAVYAVSEPQAMDIDVHAAHRGYLRGAVDAAAGSERAGTRLVCDAGVQRIERIGADWRVTTAAGVFTAPVLINAAGAWVDEIAALAGVAPIGIAPKRRTAVTFDPPPQLAVAGWPMVMAHDETLYFKPDAGRLLVSPADETPSPPCDVQPDELDIAIAIDRLEQMTTLPVRRLAAKWAGLRSFVADRTLVAGFDAQAPGFFWLTGQGGYGIQTSPAMGRITAAAVLGDPFPETAAAVGLDAARLSPSRVRALP
jgi:D-arginine dehydrogenase